MELLDVYDNDLKLTGKVIKRGDNKEVLGKDEHIAISVIFLQNEKGEFLLQRTSKEKFSKVASTGGHVQHGETPYTAIIREVGEEIGLDISKDNVQYIGYLLYDMPIRHIYYLKKDIDISKLKLQKEEVEKVMYLSVDEIMKYIDNGEMQTSHANLFKELLKHIK